MEGHYVIVIYMSVENNYWVGWMSSKIDFSLKRFWHKVFKTVMNGYWHSSNDEKIKKIVFMC